MRRRTSHPVLALVLLLAGLVLTLAAAGDRWLAHTTLDTPTWTSTSDRLIADPDVRRAIAAYSVDDALGGAGDVPGVRSGAESPTRAFLASGPGRAAWREANRDSQLDLLRALDEPRSRARGDSVQLDLTRVVSATLSRLTQIPGVGQLNISLPSAGVELTVLDPGQVRDVRRVVGVVRTLEWALPLAALAAFALALLLSGRGWPRALTRIGATILLAGVLVLISRPLLRSSIADALVSGSVDRAAVRAAWMIASDGLRTEGIGLLIGGAIVAVVSFAARLITRD